MGQSLLKINSRERKSMSQLIKDIKGQIWKNLGIKNDVRFVTYKLDKVNFSVVGVNYCICFASS